MYRSGLLRSRASIYNRQAWITGDPTMTTTKDSIETDGLYQDRRKQIDPFVFDDAVTEVFPDMIRRSIPGYQIIVDITGLIAAKRLQPKTTCYDLGCSRGATTEAILKAIGDRECKIVAIDSSASMIVAASANLGDQRVSLQQADIRDIEYVDASFVTANFTLQFLPPEDRLNCLNNIHNGLRSDGVFLISEKIDGDDEFDELHVDFKRENGYSELEINQKREALENVMKIDSREAILARLKHAGFTHCRIWFRCLNWISILASP